jgi:hypothetical protein
MNKYESMMAYVCMYAYVLVGRTPVAVSCHMYACMNKYDDTCIHVFISMVVLRSFRSAGMTPIAVSCHMYACMNKYVNSDRPDQ